MIYHINTLYFCRMHKFFFFPILFLSLVCLAQAQPLQYEISAKKTGDTTYLITLNGTLQQGGQLYAEDNAATGVEGLKMTWEAENIHAHGAAIGDKAPVSIKDPVFENKASKVYTGPLQLQQEVGASGV